MKDYYYHLYCGTNERNFHVQKVKIIVNAGGTAYLNRLYVQFYHLLLKLRNYKVASTKD